MIGDEDVTLRLARLTALRLGQGQGVARVGSGQVRSRQDQPGCEGVPNLFLCHPIRDLVIIVLVHGPDNRSGALRC